jgi:ribose transport system permease protein
MPATSDDSSSTTPRQPEDIAPVGATTADRGTTTPVGEDAVPAALAPQEPFPPLPGSSRWQTLVAHFGRWGVVLACIATGVVFYALKPDVFSQLDTWRGILDQAALPGIVAMGLTVALIVGDFDLSIGAVIGLAMGVSVSLMVDRDMAWPLAAAITVALGAVVGLVNGGLVAGLNVNSFIGTLAISSIVTGFDAKVTGQKTITEGIPQGFQDLGGGQWLFQLSTLLWIAVGIGIVLWAVMGHTEAGRYMYAVGGNSEAARLAGVRTRTLRILGFMAVGMCAALAGVLLASSSAGYYPNAGLGFLLPAFAAAFLGTAVTGGRFAIVATAFAVFFLQMLQTGLTVLNVETWVVNVVQGSVLAIAVVIGSAEARARVPRRRARSSPTATPPVRSTTDPPQGAAAHS